MDDLPVVRYGLAHLIAQTAGLEVCGEAEDGRDALQKAKRLQPDVVLMDISLDEVTHIDLVKQIHSQHDQVGILVMSMHEEVLFVERVFQAGALGYINKQATAEKIIEGLRAVAQGQAFLCERTVQRVTARMRNGAKDSITHSPFESLSNRELQVFELVGKGLSTREIANKLHLSVKTVETHYKHIREKLGLRNRLHLSRRAVEWLLNRP